jgi:pantetheine-phosphate adenylyltransferase
MGLLVDYAQDVDAGVLKGIRSQVDVAYETPMAIVNRHLAEIETVFLLPDLRTLVCRARSCVRSPPSAATSPFVPGPVARFLDTGAGPSDRRTRPTAASIAWWSESM